ncbi:hypothetical protein NW765_010597 [Fusarium oxysporum]|nr:hypothetical protein NW765_010597 [Fusarium oxysporum]
MVVISGSPWAKRLVFLVISLTIFLWWYVYSVPGVTDDVKPPPPPPKLKTNDAKPILVDKKVEGKDGKSIEGVKVAKDEKTGESVDKKGIKAFRSWSNFDIVRPKNDHTYVYRRFKSSPYKPPHIEWNPNGKELAKGYVFITPQSSGAERVLYRLLRSL